MSVLRSESFRLQRQFIEASLTKDVPSILFPFGSEQNFLFAVTVQPLPFAWTRSKSPVTRQLRFHSLYEHLCTSGFCCWPKQIIGCLTQTYESMYMNQWLLLRAAQVEKYLVYSFVAFFKNVSLSRKIIETFWLLRDSNNLFANLCTKPMLSFCCCCWLGHLKMSFYYPTSHERARG